MKRLCLVLALAWACMLSAAETKVGGREIAAAEAAPLPAPAPVIVAASPTTAKIQAWATKFSRQVVVQPLRALRSMVLSPALWIALGLTLALERLIPAEPRRKIFGTSFAHDLAWFCYEPFLHALIVATYVSLWAKLQKVYFPNLYFDGLSAAPTWVRFTLALLLLDFGYWVQHYINHRVPWLWRLHVVHHSQKQLNFFTDFRYHPLEYVIRHSFIAVPFLFFRIDPPVIAGFAVVKEWYSRFYHGNIRTNLGPLRYILVTPQSHRVHHSLEAAHQNTNFGAIFSFWDFLFRTGYKGFDEYPATGVVEPDFPHEKTASIRSVIFTPWRQMSNRLRRPRIATRESAASGSEQIDRVVANRGR